MGRNYEHMLHPMKKAQSQFQLHQVDIASPNISTVIMARLITLVSQLQLNQPKK